MSGPLTGFRVVEFANFITGPYAAQLLADLGAEVVKVEDPRGDPFRHWGEDDYSPHFRAYNRGKRSIVLDLKSEAARPAADGLIEWADVLIENYRPGVAERLGIGEARARRLNSRLIYCSIAGLGHTGPAAHRPVYDSIGQAASGLLSLLIDPADPRPVGPAFSDSLTGIFAAYGVLAALVHRERTGEGQRVSTSMLQATIGFMLESFAPFLAEGFVPGPDWRPRSAGVHTFRCADDRVLAIHLSSPPKFWTGLIAALERPELADDPRFVDRTHRVRNYDALRAELAPTFARRPLADWLNRLEAEDVPAAAVATVGDVLEDPQVRHLGMEMTAIHETKGEVRMLGFPIRFDSTQLRVPAAPPTLGQHTGDVLAELGLADGLARGADHVDPGLAS